jgi:hypothetical protein
MFPRVLFRAAHHVTYHVEFGADDQNITCHNNFSANWIIAEFRILQSYRVGARGIVFLQPAEVKDVFFSKSFRPSVGPTHPLPELIRRDPFPGNTSPRA